jgi:CMP-N-acetylneuraminic acid synthetase
MTALDDYCLVLPARKGSKGIPYKNRKLIDYTLSILPEKISKQVVIATDDEYLIEKYSYYRIFKRSKQVSSDKASTKSLFLEMYDHIDFNNIIMLYLTYPERTYKDILLAVQFYEKQKAKSMLCSKKINSSPYLMMYKNGIKGSQVIEHNLHRRQDYPECFEISHFISIFNKNEIVDLNNNMYNKDTIFYPIENTIDVDISTDLEMFNEKNKDNS